MRRILGATLLVVGFGVIAQADETKYALTGGNTKIEWVGTKPEGKHEGGFKKVTGTALVTDNSNLKLDVEIDCESLFSDDEKLTQHLKSPDFFAVKDHPKAKFKTSSVEKSDNGVKVTGDLTLLGKTKKVSFPAEVTTGDTLGIKAKFKINRQDFGMSYGQGKIDNDVEIRLDVKAKK